MTDGGVGVAELAADVTTQKTSMGQELRMSEIVGYLLGD